MQIITDFLSNINTYDKKKVKQLTTKNKTLFKSYIQNPKYNKELFEELLLVRETLIKRR